MKEDKDRVGRAKLVVEERDKRWRERKGKEREGRRRVERMGKWW